MIHIAFRNTRRQLKRSVLLGGAIAFGMLVITLLNMFAAGLTSSLRENISYVFGGHLFIVGYEATESGRQVGRIADGEAIERAIQQQGGAVASVHRRSEMYAMLIFGSRQATEQVRGVAFDAETDIAKGLPLQEGNIDDMVHTPDGLLLTSLARDKLGVEVGEKVLARMTTVTGQQNVGEFTVVGIVDDTMSLGIAASYAHLSYVNELIDLNRDEYQLLHVVVRDMAEVDRIAADVVEVAKGLGVLIDREISRAETTFGGIPIDFNDDEESAGMTSASSASDGEPHFSMLTINDIMEPIQSAFSVINMAGLGVFVILLLITAVGIMNTFRMVLMERTAEIGTMRAFGMQRPVVRRIFLWEAAFIALGGALAGMAMAWIAARVLGAIDVGAVPGLQLLATDGHFVFEWQMASVLLNMAILMTMTMLAALLPANAAARLQPAKALGASGA